MYLKYFKVFILSIVFIGCGYKPTAYYAKDEISGNVYVKLKVDIHNTTNSVLVKDAVNEMIVTQFQASLVDDIRLANTIITISLGKVKYTSLQDDNQGYTKLYRTTVVVNLSYITKNQVAKSLSVTGSYDYAVNHDTLVTKIKKDESVKIASQKALSDIFSKIAIKAL